MSGGRLTTTSSESGQALVEFSLVLPVFLLLIFGLVEFGFLFNASSSVNYVSRVAAMLAAEGGRTAGTDCMVLSAIERDLTPPSTPARVSSVEMYWSDANGNQIGSNVHRYDREAPPRAPIAAGPRLPWPTRFPPATTRRSRPSAGSPASA